MVGRRPEREEGGEGDPESRPTDVAPESTVTVLSPDVLPIRDRRLSRSRRGVWTGGGT